MKAVEIDPEKVRVFNAFCLCSLFIKFSFRNPRLISAEKYFSGRCLNLRAFKKKKKKDRHKSMGGKNMESGMLMDLVISL